MTGDYDDDDYDYDDDDDDYDEDAGGVDDFVEPDWDPQQLSALDKFSAWMRDPDSLLFRLFGYAGVGKTTLVKAIARRVGGRVLFCAYTGKAALVMRGMGCRGARTIHSAIYMPRSEMVEEAKRLRDWLDGDREEAEALASWGTADSWVLENKLATLRKKIAAGPDWTLREKLKKPRPRLIIVDECSMVGEELARDLMSFGIPIIVIGDPFQLPPVKGPKGYFIDAEPDAMLTEVHRQALDSPVIRMATKVRQYGAYALSIGDYGDSRYVRATVGQTAEIVCAADQVICGTHKTRHAINDIIRVSYGFEGVIPMPGEKLLCCRNNNNRDGMLNGSLWEVLDCERLDTGYLYADLKSLDSGKIERMVRMHAKPFANRAVFPEDRLDANEFDWGYCLTVHKAQGSQWPYVALIHDGWNGEDNFLDHWLYTAITRAQERVTIIKQAAKPTPRRQVEMNTDFRDFQRTKPRGLANRR